MTQLKTGRPPNAAGEEKRTFLPYSHGIAPKNLRVGSLYIDPVNPVGGDEDKRFDYREDIDQDEYEKRISKWCYGDDPVEKYSMRFWTSRHSGFSLTLTELAQMKFTKDKFDETSIAGTAGRRVQLKKPKKFVQEDVLEQEGVHEWLRMHASASRAPHAAFRHNKVSWSPPKLWVCSGVQMITDGKVYTGKELETLAEAQLKLDASQAAGAPPGTLEFGGGVSRGAGHGVTVEYKYKKEQVWAAEFMELGVVYGGGDARSIGKDGKPLPDFVRSVAVYDTPQLNNLGVRGHRKPEDKGLPEVPETHAHFFLVGPDPDDEGVDPGTDPAVEGNDRDKDENSTDVDGARPPVEFGSYLYVDQVKNANWDGFNEGMDYLKTKRVLAVEVASAGND